MRQQSSFDQLNRKWCIWKDLGHCEIEYGQQGGIQTLLEWRTCHYNKGMSLQRFFFLVLFHQNSDPLAEVIPCWLLNYSNVTFQLSFLKHIFSTQGVWIHKNEIQETKRSNWFPLNEISEIYFQTVLDSVRMITVVSVKLAPFCAHTVSNFGTTPKAWGIGNWHV